MQNAANNSFLPDGWVPKARGLRPTAAMPYLWEIRRTRLSDATGWTQWGRAEIAEHYIPPAQELEQYAYMRTATATAPVLPAQTATNRQNDSYIPPGWQRQIILASPTNRFVWTISRSRASVDANWSNWLLTNEPIGEQSPGIGDLALQEQTAYQLGNDYISPPAIDNGTGQEELMQNAANNSFVPTGWGARTTAGRPTSTMRYLWQIRRTRLSDATGWTQWGRAEIVEEFQRAAPPAPGIPTGVDNDNPVGTSMRVYWTSTGNFFTEVVWEYLESAAWHFGNSRVSFTNEIVLDDLPPGGTCRFKVRHISSAGAGPWFNFT